MTYGQFLLLFLVPPVLAVLLLARRAISRPAWLALAALMATALAYTTPWDNYLVIREVWTFDDDRVWGIFLWRVPLEEYLFYLLQVLLTGLFTTWLLHRRADARSTSTNTTSPPSPLLDSDSPHSDLGTRPWSG